MKLSYTVFLLLNFLPLYDCNEAAQGCMDKHRVMGILRQMEKFLKGQEIRFTEGLRIMKSKLTNLQNSVSKLPQADQSSCVCDVIQASGVSGVIVLDSRAL